MFRYFKIHVRNETKKQEVAEHMSVTIVNITEFINVTERMSETRVSTFELLSPFYSNGKIRIVSKSYLHSFLVYQTFQCTLGVALV